MAFAWVKSCLDRDGGWGLDLNFQNQVVSPKSIYIYKKHEIVSVIICIYLFMCVYKTIKKVMAVSREWGTWEG